MIKTQILKLFLIGIVLLLFSFFGVAQDSPIDAIKSDTIFDNRIHLSINDSLKINDSTSSINATSYSYTKDGKSYTVLSIDNTNNDAKISTVMLVIIFFAIIVVLLYFLFKRKLFINLNGSLTKQESKVVELIYTDKTNLQISEELFISPSTVKTHINNIYRKLNISSRNELKRFKKRNL